MFDSKAAIHYPVKIYFLGGAVPTYMMRYEEELSQRSIIEEMQENGVEKKIRPKILHERRQHSVSWNTGSNTYSALKIRLNLHIPKIVWLVGVWYGVDFHAY